MTRSIQQTLWDWSRIYVNSYSSEKKLFYFSSIPFCYSQVPSPFAMLLKQRLSKSVSISWFSLGLNAENRNFFSPFSYDFKHKTPKHPQKLSYFP